MKGVSEEVLKLVLGVIVMIMTAFLLYSVFPKSNCDELAKLSLAEVKSAIECAAGAGKEDCSKTAVVKLCQESRWSLTGFGYMQSYYGLMVPQYLLYYQQFPTKPVTETNLGSYLGGIAAPENIAKLAFPPSWSDTYPFERSTIGERYWDRWGFRPTLTQFKQFYKTKYLQEGCTSEKGLCLNTRGLEENFTMKIPEGISDIKLKRAATEISDANPKFHLASPCFAKVSFEKFGNKIFSTVQKQSTDASNYCYADEGLLNGLVTTYFVEGLCRAGDYALDLASFGTKAGAKLAAKKSIKETSEYFGEKLTKEITKQIEEEALEEAIKKTGKYGGRATETKAAEIAAEKTAEKIGGGSLKLGEGLKKTIVGESTVKYTNKKFLGEVIGKTAAKKGLGSQGITWNKISLLMGAPCFDVGDMCRGAMGCVEALMWPGMPFEELTAEKMKKFKSTTAAGEVFADCCDFMNYGQEKDPDKIFCEEPEDIVNSLKTEVGTQPTEKLNLTAVSKYLGIQKQAIQNSCGILHSDYSRTCETSDEAIENERICAGLPTHTYSLNSVIEAKMINVYFGVLDNTCPDGVKTLITTDGKKWEEINTLISPKQFPERNSIEIRAPVGETYKFNKIRIITSRSITTGVKCLLDYSSISIDPPVDTPLEAKPNVAYSLIAGRYNYFIIPENFSSNATEVCKSVPSCNYTQKWRSDSSNWIKYFAEEKREDFSISGGDKIGIMVSKQSAVSFPVSATTTTK